MAQVFTRRGVPAVLSQEGWWLDEPAPRKPDRQRTENPFGRRRGLFLLGLLVAADTLLYQTGIIVLIAPFTVGLILIGGWRHARLTQALAIVAIATLPWTEQPQLLSFVFLLLGATAAAAVLAAPPTRIGPSLLWPASSLGLWMPLSSIADLFRWINAAETPHFDQSALSRVLRDWTLPVLGTAVFATLFLLANPLFDSLAGSMPALELPPADRISFWLVMAAVIWPFLKLASFRERVRASLEPRQAIALPGLINAGSIARSLIVLNVLFAFQTVTDAAYLWGGAALPAGMSYAEYAHRGAYPLIVAALLAGAFAVVAQPHLGNRHALRALLYLWIIQTTLLVASSALRLELYVEVYGLTRLRLAAAIWMGTVLAGLALLSFQLTLGRSVGWLLSGCAWLGLSVLYGTLFLSFDRAIAVHNLSRDHVRDPYYVCQLGRAAEPARRAYAMRTGQNICANQYNSWQETHQPDRRNWGFRDWRTLRRLQTLQSAPAKAIYP